MIQRCDLELVLNQSAVAKPVFATAEEDEAFLRRFYEGVKDKLRELDLKRIRSNAEAMDRWVRQALA